MDPKLKSGAKHAFNLCLHAKLSSRVETAAGNLQNLTPNQNIQTHVRCTHAVQQTHFSCIFSATLTLDFKCINETSYLAKRHY